MAGTLALSMYGTLWDIWGHLVIWITDTRETLQKVSHSVLRGGQRVRTGTVFTFQRIGRASTPSREAPKKVVPLPLGSLSRYFAQKDAARGE